MKKIKSALEALTTVLIFIQYVLLVWVCFSKPTPLHDMLIESIALNALITVPLWFIIRAWPVR